MKHTQKTGRRFYASARCQVAQSQSDRLLLEAAAAGSIAALEDYPHVLSEMEQFHLAHLILQAVPLFSKKQYNTAVFVSAFCRGYQARIEDYSSDATAYERDRRVLSQVGAKALLQCFVYGKKAVQ